MIVCGHFQVYFFQVGYKYISITKNQILQNIDNFLETSLAIKIKKLRTFLEIFCLKLIFSFCEGFYNSFISRIKTVMYQRQNAQNIKLT